MSDAISQLAVLSLRPDVVVTVLEDEAVLLDLETKYFYSVNVTGWAIVQLFEAGATRADATARCQAWGGDADASAVSDFLDVLVNDGLVIPAANGTPAAEVSLQRPWMAPVIEKHKEPLQRIMISAFDPTLPLAE